MDVESWQKHQILEPFAHNKSDNLQYNTVGRWVDRTKNKGHLQFLQFLRATRIFSKAKTLKKIDLSLDFKDNPIYPF